MKETTYQKWSKEILKILRKTPYTTYTTNQIKSMLGSRSYTTILNVLHRMHEENLVESTRIGFVTLWELKEVKIKRWIFMKFQTKVGVAIYYQASLLTRQYILSTYNYNIVISKNNMHTYYSNSELRRHIWQLKLFSERS